MLIKAADDKSRRLALLESLMDSPVLDQEQKDWARKELKALRYGLMGERDAAYYIDNHFADAENHAVIHDLRLEVDGEVAQIDHLIISRGFTFYLLETKNFSGNLAINEFGEFSVRYSSGKSWGIPSPLEQSRRHENVLVKLLDRLGIAGRTHRKPIFKHVVLIHPRGEIRRPDAGKWDTSNVIKADQFASWRERFVEKEASTFQILGAMLNMRSMDTVREWAEKIVRQHRQINCLELPEFMKPKAVAKPSAPREDETLEPAGVPFLGAEQKMPAAPAAERTVARLTSFRLAQKKGITTAAFMQACVQRGYLELRDNRHYITPQGKAAGGEFRMGQGGVYFLWPEILDV